MLALINNQPSLTLLDTRVTKIESSKKFLMFPIDGLQLEAIGPKF